MNAMRRKNEKSRESAAAAPALSKATVALSEPIVRQHSRD